MRRMFAGHPPRRTAVLWRFKDPAVAKWLNCAKDVCRARHAVPLRKFNGAARAKWQDHAKNVWRASAAADCVPTEIRRRRRCAGHWLDVECGGGFACLCDHLCSTPGQARAANSGGKPPHSTWVEPDRTVAEWLNLAKVVCRAQHAAPLRKFKDPALAKWLNCAKDFCRARHAVPLRNSTTRC
jgi:hypothetical protein